MDFSSRSLGRFPRIPYLQGSAIDLKDEHHLGVLEKSSKMEGDLERLSDVSLSPGPAPNIAVHHLAGDKGMKKGALTPAFFIPSLLQERAVLNGVPR